MTLRQNVMIVLTLAGGAALAARLAAQRRPALRVQPSAPGPDPEAMVPGETSDGSVAPRELRT